MSKNEYSFDPWEGDPTTYDRDKWYTRSTNKHDHSTHVRLNIPKEQGGQIDDFVRNPAIPQIKSREDFIRDSINHNLRYRLRLARNPETARGVNLELLACELEQMYNESLAMEQFVEAQQQVFYRAKTSKDIRLMQAGYDAALIGVAALEANAKELLLNLIDMYETELKMLGA